MFKYAILVTIGISSIALANTHPLTQQQTQEINTTVSKIVQTDPYADPSQLTQQFSQQLKNLKTCTDNCTTHGKPGVSICSRGIAPTCHCFSC